MAPNSIVYTRFFGGLKFVWKIVHTEHKILFFFSIRFKWQLFANNNSELIQCTFYFDNAIDTVLIGVFCVWFFITSVAAWVSVWCEKRAGCTIRFWVEIELWVVANDIFLCKIVFVVFIEKWIKKYFWHVAKISQNLIKDIQKG